MGKELNDAQLVELYTRYGYLVRRRCLAVVGNAVDAEDAMQEVFLRIRRYGQPEPGLTGSTLAWLYTVANRCCFDLLDRRNRQEPVASDELAALDTRATGTAEDADRRALIAATLRGLDETTREMGLLHHLGGLTQEEVAEQLGYSRKTVGKRLKDFAEAMKLRLAGAGT